MSISDYYDIIVVGGGTAGLTAAIKAANLNLKVIVLEKGETVGPLPRGESMAYFPLEDKILGEGFVESITTVGPSFRRYHSPWDRKNTLVNVHTPYRFFPWRPFINQFEKQALKAGAQILTKCTGQSPILNEKGVCIGVKYLDQNNQEQAIYGLVTLGADGHDSVIGNHYGVDYNAINCPIMKFLGDNANVDITQTPNPQFFMISPGQLEQFPHFPPAAAYYFPIGEKKIEAGLMLRMGQVNSLSNIEIPTAEEIKAVWHYLKADYPGFSSVFENINVEYEALTQMPNAKMVDQFIQGKGGALLIGDSAGFVDANGSSGLYYGMQMAADWVSILEPIMKEIASSSLEFEEKINKIWTPEHIRDFDKQFRKSKNYKHIKQSYGLIGLSENLIFKILRKSKALNRFWWLFSLMIKSAS